MLFDGDDQMLRDYELPYDSSLLDFHRFICDDLGYDAMVMSSFFRSNERWEQLQEFTLMDMGGAGEDDPIAMENAVLGQVLRQNHDRLIYVFDQLSGRAMFIELMGTVKSLPEAVYPRLVRSEGAPPEQFDADAESAASASLFDEAMDDFFDFEGDELYDED
jgi:hypothetical protein